MPSRYRCPDTALTYALVTGFFVALLGAYHLVRSTQAQMIEARGERATFRELVSVGIGNRDPWARGLVICAGGAMCFALVAPWLIAVAK